MNDNFINVNNISSIKIINKTEVFREPFYHILYKKGDNKEITFKFLIWRWVLYTRNSVYDDDIIDNYFFDNPRTRKFANSEFLKLCANPESYFIEDGILYEKPHLYIKMINSDEFLIYKNTVEELQDYLLIMNNSCNYYFLEF